MWLAPVTATPEPDELERRRCTRCARAALTSPEQPKVPEGLDGLLAQFLSIRYPEDAVARRLEQALKQQGLNGHPGLAGAGRKPDHRTPSLPCAPLEYLTDLPGNLVLVVMKWRQWQRGAHLLLVWRTDGQRSR